MGSGPAFEWPANSHQPFISNSITYISSALVVALGDALFLECIFEPFGFFFEHLEDPQAIFKMAIAIGALLRALGLNVQADVFTMLAVVIFHQDPNLIERLAQILHAKGLILIKLEAVLVIQVNAPKLAAGQAEGDLTGRIQAGQDGVGRFRAGRRRAPGRRLLR